MQHGLGGQRGTTGPARLAATRRLGRRLIAACTRACAAAAATVTDSPTAAGGGVGEEGELPRGEGLRKTEVGREEARQVRRAAEGPMLSACRETKHAHARTHKMVERDEDSKLGPARPSDCRRLTRALLGGGGDASILSFNYFCPSARPSVCVRVCALLALTAAGAAAAVAEALHGVPHDYAQRPHVRDGPGARPVSNVHGLKQVEKAHARAVYSGVSNRKRENKKLITEASIERRGKEAVGLGVA